MSLVRSCPTPSAPVPYISNIGLGCIVSTDCPSYLTGSNSGGGGGAGEIWCLSAASAASSGATSALYAVNPDGTPGAQFPADFDFGLNGNVTFQQPGLVTTQNFITNPCPSDPFCLNGPADGCCSAPWGVMQSSALGNAATIENYCAPNQQSTTGCVPCVNGYAPIPVAYTQPSAGQYATFYACLPTKTVTLTNHAQSNCSTNDTALHYTIYSPAVGGTAVVSSGSVSPGPLVSLYLAPGEQMQFMGQACCECPSVHHTESTPTYVITYDAMAAADADVYTVVLSGDSHCSGFDCRNGAVFYCTFEGQTTGACVPL